MTEAEAKEVFKEDKPVRIKTYLEALDVAMSVLGDDCTMSDIWKWCNEEKVVDAGHV